MSVQPDHLPTGWAAPLLGAVVEYGSTLKAEPSELADDTWVLELEDVEKDSARVVQRLTFAERQSKSTKNRFYAGDVLYGKLRPYLNKVVYADRAGVCTTEIVPLRPNEAVDGRYLFHWLRHPTFLAYVIEVSHGVNMPRLGTDAGRAAPFVLAPKNEQRRIADKLDTVLARVDTVNDRLARVAPLLKRFRQSVLAAATSGKLTNDSSASAAVVPVVLRQSEQSPLPDGWRWVSLVDVARLESGHTPRKSVPEYWDGGEVPWISLQDIRAADGIEIFDTKLRPTEAGIANSSARLLPAGTVCFCRDISFGYVTIMGREMATSQHFANWVCGLDLTPKYLLYAFMSSRAALAMSGQGTTVTTIYMPALKGMRLALPPTSEQCEIVRRVELLFGYADRLEARLQAAQTAADRLTPALLAKAFRGELVPQDPNDEPASELLNRLAAQRAASTVPGRPRRTAKHNTN